MTRLAKILVMALAISLIAASSAFARAPQHQGQTGKNESDTAAIVVVAALGLLIAGSALVPFTRTARLSAR
jgi:hypothetical protein